jgi:hypothetical protein
VFRAWCLLGIALATPFSASAALGGDLLDKGRFVIRKGDRVVGSEDFVLETRADSLIVQATQRRTIPGPRGDEAYEKNLGMVVHPVDMGMRSYNSSTELGGHTLVRGLVIDDTLYTAYREMDGVGEGDRRVLPPGRLFVLDEELMMPFDLICRSLFRQTFESRPLSLLVLGPRDTLLEVRATALGEETIRWGERPVAARKFSLTSGRMTFTCWAGLRGELLRLSEPVSGLSAERDAPPVKRPASSSPTKPGG